MSRKRRLQINAGIIALCITALAVDKLLLSDGARPELAGAAEPASGQSISDTDATSENGPAPLALRLDQKLAEYDDVDPPRDPFQLSDTMKAALPPPPSAKRNPQTVGTPPGPPELTAEGFESIHRLEAVLVAGSSSMAVVNGQTVYLGESLDGFALVSVEDRSAVFERGEERVTLILPLE
ncbi:MAG: hypothetical protein JSU68_00495 [Phycisphaerales bacterium]|nr:MAG: hypothetical protein JSU68_00495 [Phycisphaerales bacterium]